MNGVGLGMSGGLAAAGLAFVLAAPECSGPEADAQAEPTSGIWVERSTLEVLPTSGPGWKVLEAQAREPCGAVRLSDKDASTNVCVVAKALVFVRTGAPEYRTDVVSALERVAAVERYRGRALALGRELAAYVIAADLIELGLHDPALDRAFRSTLTDLVTAPTTPGPRNLVHCHEDRPNNWGTQCGASRIAVAAYLGDRKELERAARVFRGWLGDRSAYDRFTFRDDLSWHCDPKRPVAVNPVGCTRRGHSLDGALPDDMRRAGPFSWPPPRENYAWEALQGALVQAVILQRAGYPAFEWEDRALLRAVRWLYEQARYPAEGDDGWQIHLVNHYYGTSFPAAPSRPGKNMGWTSWTHPPGERTRLPPSDGVLR